MSAERLHRLNPLLLDRARAMRRLPARPEQKLWQCLRNRQLNGYKFRRQFPIGRYIADFYCADCKLIIELDGESHNRQIEHDLERNEWMAREGYRVLRFTNDDLLKCPDAVLVVILNECNEQS